MIVSFKWLTHFWWWSVMNVLDTREYTQVQILELSLEGIRDSLKYLVVVLKNVYVLHYNYILYRHYSKNESITSPFLCPTPKNTTWKKCGDIFIRMFILNPRTNDIKLFKKETRCLVFLTVWCWEKSPISSDFLCKTTLPTTFLSINIIGFKIHR